MNIKNIFTQTAALAVCMSCAVLAVAGPGDGKTLEQAAKAAFRVPRTTRGTLQRYSFTPETSRHIRAGITAGRLERAVEGSAAKAKTILTPVLLGQSSKEISFSLRQMVASVPVEKEVLLANLEEQAFYAPEIAKALELHSYLLSLHKLDDEEEAVIAEMILKNVKNHSLQTYLFRSLADKDLYMLDLDLMEYFSLDEEKSVELSAFNYTLRHPHQQILMMRRLLNNPLVDEEVKKPLREFLNKSKIKPQEFPAFQTAIFNVYQQYQNRLAAATESDIIQIQADYYAKLTDRLGDFIATHDGRRPKWNTADPKEMLLFDEIEWMQSHQDINAFEPLLSYQNALNIVWDNAAPTYLTRQETLELYDAFVKETGRFYPRSLRDKLKPGEKRFEREEELSDNLSYWRVEDSSLFYDLTTTYQKYHH